MKLSHKPAHVSEVSVYDINHAVGVAADLSHIDTDTKVNFGPFVTIKYTVQGADGKRSPARPTSPTARQNILKG